MKYILLLLLLLPLVSAENATVKGVVIDSLDNLVGFAEIKLDCMEGIFTTDKFGTFSVANVPEGQCRVYAAFRNGVGFQTVDVKANQTIYLELKLDKTIVNIPDRINYVLPIVVVVVLLVVVVLYLKFRRKKTEKVELKHPSRIQDILKTLKPKEKQIVEYLLQNNNAGSQAKIRHATGLARTSLSRCLQDLESKNIIAVERLGKLVKVGLTDWFLGK